MATTKTIGVISDFVASGHFASEMLAGACLASRESDHLLLIGETQGDPDVLELLVEELLDRQVDGIIYATLVTAEVTVPRLLTKHRTVLLNCVDPSTTLPAVLPDELEGGRSAAQVVLGAGLGPEVYAVGEDTTPNAIAGRLRMEGLRAGLGEAGRSLTGVIACEWAVVAAYEAVSAWLDTGVRPTALICLNDRVAMGTYQALAEHGLEIPRDVSVVSFDGSELASWLRPAVTSVFLPYAELGALAIRTLLGSQGPNAGVLRVPMPISWGASVQDSPQMSSGLR